MQRANTAPDDDTATGGPWIENGRIEIGRELPVNTHGGLLFHGHIEGMLHVTEAIKQLCGGSAYLRIRLSRCNGIGKLFGKNQLLQKA